MKRSDHKPEQKGQAKAKAKAPAAPAKPALAAGLDEKDLNHQGLVDTGPILTPTEGRVAELRLAAADYVQRTIDCDLDDSEESLAFVDHYIDRVRSGGKLSDQVLRLVAGALGVYLGEVARTRFGGRWVSLLPSAEDAEPHAVTPTPILDSIDDPVGWRLQLAAVPLIVDPIGMALSALQRPGEAKAEEKVTLAESDADEQPNHPNHDDHNGQHDLGDDDASLPASEDPVGFATTPALTQPLRAALSRLPPVSIDYYYSLTGRFETMAYTVELLAELQQMQREPAPSPEQ